MAEIILEPTAQSKVIPLSFRLNDTDTSLVSQLVTNRQFNTADTDAWFSFTLEGLAATTGTFDLTLINLQDKSVFNHTDKVFNTNPFYYKLDSGTDELTNEIRHAGKWVGQLVVTLANGDSATRKFIFGIEGHILDGTVVQTILLEDYNALIASIESAKDELTQYNIDYASLIGTVTEQEAARLEAEELRVIADALRETKEGIRQATFEANEVIRDGVVDSAIEGEMIAQTVETKLTEKEATFAPRMISLESELANVVKKGDLVADVRDFGAVGDYNHVTGIGTDDTQAFIAAIDSLPATGGTLYVPVGNHLIPDGGIIIDKQISIIGDSSGTYDDGGSRIFTLSPTANLFTCTKGGSVVVGIAFVNASPTRPTAGSALLCTDFDWGRIDRCLFRDFWNNVQVDSGYFYSIRDSAFLAPVNYGCYMRNIAPLQHDHGDQVLEGCNFSKYGDTIDGGTAVRWESGGGLRLVGCKVNAGTQPGYTDTGFFENGFVTVMQPGGTSVHTITGCSVEGWLTHGSSVSGVANATFGKISIVGNEFLASGSGGACVHADGNNMDSLDNLVITGNVGYGYSGGVMLYNLSKAVVTGNNFADCVQAGMTIANVTDLIQSDNLFKTSVWDLDASNFASAKAGHRRKSWEWGHDVYNNVGTFLAGKICPGEYAEIIVSVKVYGNVSAVGGFIMEQKRAVARVLNNAIVTQTIGTDIAVGAGAAEIAITYDVDTSPTYVVPKITTINGKSFTGAVEVSVDGAVYTIYYQ